MNIPNEDVSITLIPLGTTYLHAPFLSHELVTLISKCIEKKEKLIILYNRRGSGRAWICQDCGHFPLCPHCDIALAYHTTPSKKLICHQCNYTEKIPSECPKCGGTRFEGVGIGLQRVSNDIERLFPGIRCTRFDSDSNRSQKSELSLSKGETQILLCTYPHLFHLHDPEVRHIVFLLFESDLTLPDYRMEEDLYHTLEYAKKSHKSLYIQTYIPEHPLIRLIMEGNYRDFLREMSKERQAYNYPPYTEFVVIHVRDSHKEKVQDIISKLVNKIRIVKHPDVFLGFDIDIWEKHNGEWIQKVILKGKHLESLLIELQTEVVRNRAVSLEWR